MSSVERKAAISVDELLNNVSYADNEDYEPTKFALEMVNFIKLVNGVEGETNKTPVLHMRMLDKLVSGDTNIINMCYRGAAKSTLMEYIIFYIAVFGVLPKFGRITFMLYVSDSIENGIKTMRKSLEYRWENSDFLRKFLPKARFTDVRWDFWNMKDEKLTVRGFGAKSLSLDSRLHTDNGTITMKDCIVGDTIIGADGLPCKIIKKSEVFHRPMYQLVLEDGRTLKVSDEHINSVIVKRRTGKKSSWEYHREDIYTHELIEMPLQHVRYRKKKNGKDYTSKENLLFIENCRPVERTAKELPLDPYVLGLLIGDGSLRENGSCVLHGHIDDMSFYKQYIPYELGKPYIDKRNSNVESISIKGISQIIRDIDMVGHGNNKRIPSPYMYGSIEQRLELLKGLMDTDGTISENGRCSFTSNSEGLVDDISSLVRSLGGTAKKHNMNKAFRVEIWIEYVPFKLFRKAIRFKHRTKNFVAIKEVNRINDEPSQCIAVDNTEHQFIADDYFRTHNTGVRGTRESGDRPQVAFLDDLISDEDARSATVISSIEDTVYKAIDYALDPSRRLIMWNGTPFNQNDPLYKATESGAWAVSVYPVCEQFDELTTEDTFKGAWPDRHTYKYVKNQYEKAKAAGRLDSFNQELMLRIVSEEDRLVKDGDIVWYDRSAVLQNKEKYNWYITTDFATSEKTSADFSVISVWAYSSNGDWLWVDGIVKRQLMDKNIDDLFNFISQYKPLSVGIEVSGQQKGFIDWIRREMVGRNIFFNLAKDTVGSTGGIRPTTDKLTRFMTVLPLIKQKKVWFPKDMETSIQLTEAMNELRSVVITGFKSKHDDFVDTISMLSVMKPFKPTVESKMKLNDKSQIWEEDDDDNDKEKNSYIF